MIWTRTRMKLTLGRHPFRDVLRWKSLNTPTSKETFRGFVVRLIVAVRRLGTLLHRLINTAILIGLVHPISRREKSLRELGTGRIGTLIGFNT